MAFGIDQTKQAQSGQPNMMAGNRYASPTNGAFSGGSSNGLMKQQQQGQPVNQNNSWAGPTQSGTAVSAASNGAVNNGAGQSQYDPRLMQLYQQYGKTPGERGSGFGDAAYWNDQIGSAGWGYIGDRLGKDLAGTGTDMPGPGDVGNTSGQGQYAMQNQMGQPNDMQGILQMFQQMMQGQKQGPAYMGSQLQQQGPQQMMKPHMNTSLAQGGYGPSNGPSMDISSFLGR